MIKRNAYAKINLYLDVLNKLENGYHNIKSVMQQISLYDSLSLDVSDTDDGNKITILCENSNIKCDDSNLIYKATVRFLDATGIKNKSCTFNLEKNIPVSAGMAGGSTDAACALLLLNEAFDFPVKNEDLLSLGAKIGADVAFCIHGGTALCYGIGEKITTISNLKDVLLVCAIDSSSVSTPYAFSLLDEKYGTHCTDSGNIQEMIDAITAKNLKKVSSSLYNKFENVIIQNNPNIALIKETLINNGAIGALMSGSGPSVFGIFENEFDQKRAYCALKNANINAFLCKTL